VLVAQGWLIPSSRQLGSSRGTETKGSKRGMPAPNQGSMRCLRYGYCCLLGGGKEENQQQQEKTHTTVVLLTARAYWL